MTGSREIDRSGLAVALGAAALGSYVLWEAQFFSPLGSVFPRFVAVVLLVSAAILALVVLVHYQRPAKEAGGSNARRVALALALMAWVALIPLFGFQIASLLGFAIVGVVAKYDRWSMRGWSVFALTTVVAVMVFCYVFLLFLNVPLPAGALFAQ